MADLGASAPAPSLWLGGQHSGAVPDRLGVGFWQQDLQSGALDWDAQMFRIHGRDPALGAPVQEQWLHACVHPLDRAWVADSLRQLQAEGAPVINLCFRAVQPDSLGGQRWVQLWGRRLQLDGQSLDFGMHLDVTDHQRQHHLLARERERTSLAIAAAEVGVWECDPHGRLCHANEVMYRQLGLDTAAQAMPDPAALTRRVRRLTQHEDWGRLQERFRRRLANGEPFRHELPLRRRGHRARWLALQGQALRGPDGRVLGMAGVQIDITERKQAEAAHREAQRLEQISRDKSLFMARMSHELRTPMNAVLGFTRLLEDDALEPPTPRQRDRLARIAQAGDRLLALIDNLLDLAQLDADAAPAPGRPLSLSEWLREAAAAVAGEAERAGVRLVLPHGVSGQVFGDRRRLVQALGHVLLQVVQRCAAGAVVVLEAGMERRPHPAADGDAASSGMTVAEGLVEARDDSDDSDDSDSIVVRIFDPALPVPGQASLFDHADADADADAVPAGRPGLPREPAGQAVFDADRAEAFTPSAPGLSASRSDAAESGVDLGLRLALRLVGAVGGRIQTRELTGSHTDSGAMAGPSAARSTAAAPRRVHELRLPGMAHAPRERVASRLRRSAGPVVTPLHPGGAGPGQRADRAEHGDREEKWGDLGDRYASDQGRQHQRPAQAAPSALHVLCVEDNPVNLLLVREIFALRPGVRLSTAVDGGSGLALALAERPDLVLLDVQLPDISGLEVLRRLRAEPSLAACIVIALSADAMPEHIAAGRAAGFDDYWTKPIQFDRFLADIDQLAQAHAQR